MLGKRGMLGLAVTNRSITAVEVVPINGGGRASRSAELVFTDDLRLAEPVALGKALKQLLRREGFSVSRCMIGIEAGWLTARDKTLPPGAGESVTEILSLMIEQEFAGDRKDLVFDYSLETGADGKPAVLLVAAQQQAIDQLTAMAAAASLSAHGITVSTIALAGSADGAADRYQLVLHLFGGGAELALRAHGALGMVRRLPVPIPAGAEAEQPWADGHRLQELINHLRRVVALLPGAEPGSELARELLIWDETGLDPRTCDTLSEQLSLPARLCKRPEGLAPDGASRPAPGAQFSAAAAMALAALRGRPPAVDLLHSRLAPRKGLAIGKKVAWAAAVVAAFVVAATVLVLDWRRDSIEGTALQAKLDVMADDLAEANDVIAKVAFARPWYDRRPSYLDCMRELTLAFPQEGLVWTTSLAIQEDMRVVVSGKAVNESAVLDVLDRLKANPKLAEVKPLYLRQAGRGISEIAFAMSFTFMQSDGTWSSRNAKKSSSPRR
ncbi:MAG TPA: hypothetical protein VNA25_18275 [Phycisphaerae bacterium]|nr:hypothetical protein [Phycisphaerae bacterium]